MRIQPFDGLLYFCIGDPVFISFPAGTIPWMEGLGDLLRAHYPDILRKALVDSYSDLFRRNPGIGVKHRHISQGMYSRICPAGSCQFCLFPQQFTKGLREHFLYRQCVVLNLPPMIIRSIIGHGQFYSHTFLHSDQNGTK